MQPLVIVGASGHGRVVADAAQCAGQFALLGFLDATVAAGATVAGLPVLGDDERLPELAARTPNLACILGVGDNATRARLTAALSAAVDGLRFAAVVHPAAVVAADVAIGAGAFVAASATLNCGARVGEHAVVNTGASIDHDCDLGAFAFVGPGAALAGGVRMERGSFLGVGASVLPGLVLGEDAVVGGGAVVTRDVPARTIVAGNPARLLER